MGHDLRIALGRRDLPLRSNISNISNFQMAYGDTDGHQMGRNSCCLGAGVSFLSSSLNIDLSESKRSNPEFVESRECMFSFLAVVKQANEIPLTMLTYVDGFCANSKAA